MSLALSMLQVKDLQEQLEQQRQQLNTSLEAVRAELSATLSALPAELVQRGKDKEAEAPAPDSPLQQLQDELKHATEAAEKERAAHVANLKAQAAYLLEAERTRVRELEGKLASSCAEAAAVRDEGGLVWEYAAALVSLVTALEGWHYPATEKSGVR